MSQHDVDPELMQALWEAGKAAARHLGYGEPEYMTICGKGEQIAMQEERKPRDTQFAGWASLLADELKVTGGYPISEVRTLIARRAYDLVQHAVGYSLEYLDECGYELSGSMGKRIQPTIPDWKEWPKEE